MKNSEPRPEVALTFQQLRTANVERCNTAFAHGLDDWSLTDWACALAGEVGEACNIIKKLHRGDEGFSLNSKGRISVRLPAFDMHPSSWDERVERGKVVHQQLADELADVLCYLDLLAARAGIDLEEAVRRKFNAVSDKRKSEVKL